MHMIRHQAVSPEGDAFLFSVFLEQAKIIRIVIVAEKYLLPSVSALDDMMGDAGDDDAGDTGHIYSSK